MYFIITALAAFVTTIMWYVDLPNGKYRISKLCLIYWGATLMWLVDHVIAYFYNGGNFIEVNLDGTLLGISVVFLGLLVWVVPRFCKKNRGDAQCGSEI